MCFCSIVFHYVDTVQILYKDSEHADSAAAAEPDAATNTDDGGVSVVFYRSLMDKICILFGPIDMLQH